MREPRAALASAGSREGELLVFAKTGMEPGGGVAEAFARVPAPGRRSPRRVGPLQFSFTPLGAPAQLTTRVAVEFGSKNELPAAARGIG